MARSGTPKGGLNEFGERVYVNGGDFTLVAYTNPPNSLGDDTVAADLVQPAEQNGYAPILLNGTWSVVDGLVTYDHGTPDDPGWTATGPWSAPVTGSAMIYGTRVMHFKDYNEAGESWTAANARKLAIDINNLVG